MYEPDVRPRSSRTNPQCLERYYYTLATTVVAAVEKGRRGRTWPTYLQSQRSQVQRRLPGVVVPPRLVFFCTNTRSIRTKNKPRHGLA